MITIDQLLESVDLDFEPRFVTKDKNGMIKIFEHRPKKADYYWLDDHPIYGKAFISFIKLAEFDGKDWQECIYEVPRKTTGNEIEQKMLAELERKLNAIVDAAIEAVNELKAKESE